MISEKKLTSFKLNNENRSHNFEANNEYEHQKQENRHLRAKSSLSSIKNCLSSLNLCNILGNKNCSNPKKKTYDHYDKNNINMSIQKPKFAFSPQERSKTTLKHPKPPPQNPTKSPLSQSNPPQNPPKFSKFCSQNLLSHLHSKPKLCLQPAVCSSESDLQAYLYTHTPPILDQLTLSRFSLSPQSIYQSSLTSRPRRDIHPHDSYVKVQEYSTSQTTSFSSMDQNQFTDVTEGYKHTQKWVTVKKSQPEVEEERAKRQGQCGRKQERNEEKGNSDWKQGEGREKLSKKPKEVRKQRIKNECSEYLQATVLEKLRNTKKKILNTKIRMKRELSSIISSKSVKDNTRCISKQKKEVSSTRSVERTNSKAMRCFKQSNCTSVRNLAHRSKSVKSAVKGCKKKSKRKTKSRVKNSKGIVSKMSSTNASRSKSCVSSRGNSNIVRNLKRAKSSRHRKTKPVRKQSKRMHKKDRRAEAKSQSRFAKSQRASRWFS
ncbi:unnamed protein product [Moneuplotes crassus]|uniref:Uncharacterized protein n=1 Tax=Euplotes crassus TaxID=5936 RepID=A0AAD1ULA8_EUPCR|nr:unnamed protein product [Moneuplotes crassus]